MDTKVLVEAHAACNHPQREIEQFHALACAALLHASTGLEPLGDEAAAAYLSAHPRLFNGISYLPNLITPEMLTEARAYAFEPRVAEFLKDRF